MKWQDINWISKKTSSAALIIKRNKKARKQNENNVESEYGWIDALKKPELIEKCVKLGLKKSHSMKVMKSKLKETHAYQERFQYLSIFIYL